VGIPDLGSIGKRAVLVEWQTFPDQTVDPRFVERPTGELKALGAQSDDDLFFIAVREAGAWLRLRRWPRRAIGPVTMSLAVSKDRSTTIGTAAPPAAGRRPVFPGFRASGCPRRLICLAKQGELGDDPGGARRHCAVKHLHRALAAFDFGINE
jgi:hypothetical protein